MKWYPHYLIMLSGLLLIFSCDIDSTQEKHVFFEISGKELKDKIKGAWALQTIGVTYGGPTEFRYLKTTIPDSIEIAWTDTTLAYWMENIPGLYDDVYMDLTFMEVMDSLGIDAPAEAHAAAYARAKYFLWHANQQGRYNILHGIKPPESGHWLNNPHADDIDFQIEADFAGIMSPGMPNAALEICDRIGHIMNYGDGYYGGVLVAGMYCFAFVEDDIPTIIDKGLSMIPKESTFYQCIADVIHWHKNYPEDWRKNWQKIEEKWGEDIGCPDGAFEDFNIDAKINAAYVVLGMLYGNGDVGKTMEIATRAGQDSDCNPATAGAILGTVIGYDAIPEYWRKGLSRVEDLDFKYTSTSLNDAYEMSYHHALQLIENNGGEIKEDIIRIKIQEPVVAPFEQSFPGYKLAEKKVLNQRILTTESGEIAYQFEGVGVVLTGRVRHVDFDNRYALIHEEETLDNYVLRIAFSIDGKLAKTMELPIYFIERAHELFFNYELPPGGHTLSYQILNPHEKVYLHLGKLFSYKKST